MKIYVKGKSKKAINEKLSNGEVVSGYNYSMFDGGGTYVLDKTLETGTIISIYEKIVNGSPYAKSYGTWNADKFKII